MKNVWYLIFLKQGSCVYLFTCSVKQTFFLCGSDIETIELYKYIVLIIAKNFKCSEHADSKLVFFRPALYCLKCSIPFRTESNVKYNLFCC